MEVKIRLKQTSQAIVYNSAKNAYQKGDLYCVFLNDETVKKYPIADIFDIEESYSHPETVPVATPVPTHGITYNSTSIPNK